MNKNVPQGCIFNKSLFFFKIILVSRKKFNKAFTHSGLSFNEHPNSKRVKLCRLSISDRLWYRARFSWTAPDASRDRSGRPFPQTRNSFQWSWEDQRSDNARCGKARFFREIRSSIYASRVKMAEGARAARSNRRCPMDHGCRLKVVGRENKHHRRGTAKVSNPRTGPTCLLRSGRLALLQSAAGDVLARVHLDVRHPSAI